MLHFILAALALVVATLALIRETRLRRALLSTHSGASPTIDSATPPAHRDSSRHVVIHQIRRPE